MKRLSMNGRMPIGKLKTSGLLLLLCCAVAAYILWFVSRERTFYSWDLANYQNIAYQTADQFRESAAEAFDALRASWIGDYNALFAIPLVPFLLVLGKSRLVFELALALVYLVPFSLVMGAVATRMIAGAPPRRVFWSAAVVTLLTPATWAALLRGYPDVGAATLMGLAVWIYISYLTSRRRVLLIPAGCLLALAILFRRHFAYVAVAFTLAAVMYALAEFWTAWRQRTPQAVKNAASETLGLILMLGVAGITLLVVSSEFTVRVLMTNFATLYSSYLQPVSVVADTYWLVFGGLAWLGAIAGFVFGFLRRTLTRMAIFVVIFCVASISIWTLLVRQLGLHYALHFVPLVVLGLVALGWTVWLQTHGRIRTTLLGMGGIFLCLNVVAGLTSAAAVKQSMFSELFAGQNAPLVNPEYDDIIHLLDHLHEVVPTGAPIYIVASSEAWNNDLLLNAERIRQGEVTLHFVNAPQVDSRDTYPLAALLRAQYVVVFEPFQHHMPVEEQDVMKVIYDLFTQPNNAVAQDFAQLPEKLAFNDGVSATIYKRVRPASLATSLALWQFVRSSVPERPGGQLDWADLGQAEVPRIGPKADGSYSIRLHPVAPDGIARNTVLYLVDLAATVSVSGTVKFIDDQCQAVKLRFSTATSRPGQVVAEIPYRRSGASEFQFSFVGAPAQNLLLDVLSADPAQSLDVCFVRVNLQVTD